MSDRKATGRKEKEKKTPKLLISQELFAFWGDAAAMEFLSDRFCCEQATAAAAGKCNENNYSQE